SISCPSISTKRSRFCISTRSEPSSPGCRQSRPPISASPPMGRSNQIIIGTDMTEYNIFTSESVSEGHPDKIADQISDAVLDAILAKDAKARVACETMVKTGVAIVSGEI